MNGPKNMSSKVKKSLNTLLTEVFNGNFNDFRAYLAQENLTNLVLAKRSLGTKNLALLATALQGTQVATVDLMGNGIGPQGAKDFVQNLQGTQVTAVYLGVNPIGAQGAKDFALCLKGTQVTTANLGDIGQEAEIILQRALAKNNFRRHLAAPLMFASMHTNVTRQLTVNKKYENCNEEEQLKFVWEILQSVPKELRFLIINLANRKTGLNTKKALAGFCKQREKRQEEMRPLLFEFKESPTQDTREALNEEENAALSKKLNELKM